MKLRIILETIQDQMNAISQRLSIEPDDVILIARRTSNKHWKFVLNQWFQNKIRLPEDSLRVKEAITSFEKYRKSLSLKDINQYKTISEIDKAIQDVINDKNKEFMAKINKRTNVKVISKKGPYTTIIVDDVDDLMDLGEGTKWCTRRSYPESQAAICLNIYKYVYMIFKDDKPIIQATSGFEEINTADNIPVNERTKNLGGGLSIEDLLPKPTSNSAYFCSHTCFNYATRVLMSRDAELESEILKHPDYAFYYATYMIGGRWPEAEPTIMKQPDSAVRYASNILKKIDKNFRWFEAEPIILKDVDAAVDYADKVIEGRWPEAESVILADPNNHIAAFQYAKKVIGDRWYEAEPMIIVQPRTACLYAADVIKNRWPEAEKFIYNNRAVWLEYTNLVIDKFGFNAMHGDY